MFTIIIPVYNQYELLRQCIESIHRYGDWQDIKQIIIVDDYSDTNGRLRDYENYIEKCYPEKIRVIKFDGYRISIHVSENHISVAKRRDDPEYKKVINTRQNMGHGYSLQIGIENATTQYILGMDADCCFLKNSRGMFKEIAELFNRNSDVMCIGQLAGVMSHDNEVIKGDFFDYINGNRSGYLGGTPGSPACFFRKSNKFNIFDRPEHRGWALANYARQVLSNGYSLMNYPVFSKKKVFHVGGAVLLPARFYGELGKEGIKYGMLKEPRMYGGRQGDNMFDWYQGRYLLDMTTRDYIKYLSDKYSKPFDDIQPPINDNLFYTAEREMRPVRI